MRLVRWAVPALILAVLATMAPAGDRPSLQTTEMGAGGASLVFIHGIGGTRTDWLPLVKRLKDRYRLVMVELPGHGSSPLPDPFSLEAAADAVDSVIALQKPESTIVVGQGVGGMLAVQALARHPGHARGLVLIDSQMKSPVPVDDQMVTQLVRFMDSNYETFSKMVFTGMGRDSTEKALLLAKSASVPPVTVKAYFRNLLLADANRELKSLGFPVRMAVTERLWPAGELWGPLSRKLGMDDSTLVEPHRIAKTGAFVVKEQPDTLAAILSEYAAARFAAKK